MLEITLRVQRLAAMPDLDAVVACLPEESPAIGADTLVRAAPVVEQVYEPGGGPRFAVETTYQGTLRLDEAALNDASTLAGPVGCAGSLGGVGARPPRRPRPRLPAPRSQRRQRREPLT